jgi:hypothetical protein
MRPTETRAGLVRTGLQVMQVLLVALVAARTYGLL